MTTTSTPQIPPQQGSAPGAACLTAQLLLTDDTGRVLLAALPGQGRASGLPGGPLGPGEAPASAAGRAARAATGLPRLAPGDLLAVDWHAGAGPGEDTGVVFVYGHPTLTAHQVAALCADTGLPTGPRFVSPTTLAQDATGKARRILAALHARVDGVTADLEDGRPRTPRVLDRHQLLARAAAGRSRAVWKDGRTLDATVEVEEVRGWLFVPDGRVLLLHDPASGHTFLPGGPLTPHESEDPAATLARLAADTTHTMINRNDRRLTGHQITGLTAAARVATIVTFIGPLTPAPCATTPLRLLASPEQAAELLGGGASIRAEMAGAADFACEIGLPQAPRRPVTELPVEGVAL